MKSASFKLRIVALPLFTLALSGALVAQQYTRRNRYALELKEAQTEYVRQTREMKSVPASASSLFSESKEHTHSDSEEGAPHAETSPPEGSAPMEAKPSPPPNHETPKANAHGTTPQKDLPR
jgi:hypothetical protein